MTRKRMIGGQSIEFVTEDQPINTGTAPAAPPITILLVEDRLSHKLYTNT